MVFVRTLPENAVCAIGLSNCWKLLRHLVMINIIFLHDMTLRSYSPVNIFCGQRYQWGVYVCVCVACKALYC